ncbi:SMI1/KNR4 family protein SUKH-1 [Krasilnikovia cinnamomea]|uniref:SMI1/KNR4 family protein SUKH-1 n=1 Tax=Krasilnikovia cinnamomea TaxID=349313 RepID=A0A4Q7ZRC2_9ACTN|nr:SMI1/KNR4 family protein [Krasilnikovia cinnamomea]RZU53364.1 SMI1/KNR4 family protein SUKH-1 [Krasilnikovia cinnamomea]
MELRYHQRAVALDGVEPVVSAEADALLDRLEARHGVTLPAAVREWYRLEGAVEMLRRRANGDHPYKVEDLGNIEVYHFDSEELEEEEERTYDPVADGLLPVMVENQGVWYWAVRLDGSDDPEVVAAMDEVAPHSEWQPFASSFSDFALIRVWDDPGDAGCRLSGRSRGLEPDELAGMGAALERLPDTFKHMKRFEGRDGRQRIQLVDLGSDKWSLELLWAETEELLAELVTTVVARTGVTVDDLRPVYNDPVGARVLAALRTQASDICG